MNYAERHRAGLRVGTAITEGTANFLVNRRMNKSQQMRWSRRGADLLLQVRCAVYNGTFNSGFGQKFHPANRRRRLTPNFAPVPASWCEGFAKPHKLSGRTLRALPVRGIGWPRGWDFQNKRGLLDEGKEMPGA